MAVEHVPKRDESAPRQPRVRRQTIRDAILAFLTEPRSARAIAERIGRPVPTATGHLAAISRRGLAVRLGYSAYARADYTGPPVSFYEGRQRLASRTATILAFLTEPRTTRSVADHLGQDLSTVRARLETLRRRGVLVSVRHNLHARAGACTVAASGLVKVSREPVRDVETKAKSRRPRSQDASLASDP